MERAEQILRYWFGDGSDGWSLPADRQPLWFRGGPQVDEEIRLRFGPDVEVAVDGGFADWKATPRGRLALVILLDQFTRNVHRGTPGAFAGDRLALPLAVEALEKGIDRELRPVERPFLYLPLEHAEDSKMQALSVDAFRRLAEEAPAVVRPAYDVFLDYAIQHQVIVDRFGRFPPRNAILGRETTPEEAEFLKQPGSSF
ncbi:MAG TPA: DUF924 family protein [Vulgatibacter sp.]